MFVVLGVGAALGLLGWIAYRTSVWYRDRKEVRRGP